MTRVGRRLIEDFLIPSLNEQKYGERLKWEDKEKRIFSIRWSHKNAAKWSLDDTVVFQDWDRMKGHWHPDIKGYYMQAKQRFRAALYKLNTVKKLKSDDKHVKKYQLVLENEKKRSSDYMDKVKQKKQSMDNGDLPSCIPTPVICNTRAFIKSNFKYPYSPDAFKTEVSKPYNFVSGGSIIETVSGGSIIETKETDFSTLRSALRERQLSDSLKRTHKELEEAMELSERKSSPSERIGFHCLPVRTVPQYRDQCARQAQSKSAISWNIVYVPCYRQPPVKEELYDDPKQSMEGVLNLSVKPLATS